MAGPMNCFAIRIEPTMPVILGKRLNLDAILAFLLLQRLRAEGVDEYDALQRAHTEIPLARVNSVFAGSSALIRKTTTNQRTVYGSLQRHVTAIPNVETLLEKNASASRRSGGREFDKIEKRYQTIVSNFEYYDLHKPNSASRRGSRLGYLVCRLWRPRCDRGFNE